MHKITITSTYNLYKYNINAKKYELKGKFDKSETVVKYVEKFAPNSILPGEIEEAVRFMSDKRDNTAEFGYNGYFTVSYFDEKVEEAANKEAS